MNLTTNSTLTNWSLVKKLCFRFFFCFFLFEFFLNYFIYQLFSWDYLTTSFGFKKLFAPLYAYINDHIFHFEQAETNLSVDDFNFHVIAVTTAVVITIFWSIFDRKRNAYTKADFWLRYILRYVLAIIIFSYGISKLIPVQMEMPDTHSLDTAIGKASPFQLFWTTMAVGSFYEPFTGLVEITAALLLFFPRTYVLGLIVLTGTMLNVVMINIGFDIGVTYYSLLLLTATLYLLFPYLTSIISFLLSKQPVLLYQQPKSSNSKLNKTIFIFSAGLFIISAIASINDVLSRYGKTLMVTETGKLAWHKTKKTFSVTSHIQNADTMKMVIGDSARWKYWTEYEGEDKNYVTVLTMHDDIAYNFSLADDTARKTIQLEPKKQPDYIVINVDTIYLPKSGDTTRYTFSYITNNSTKEKTLTDTLHKMVLVIKEITNEDWPLLKKRNKFFPFDF